MTTAAPCIGVVLGHKEQFTADGAGASALGTRDLALASRYRDRIVVFGRPLKAPFDGVAYQAPRLGPGRLLGHNQALAAAIARVTRTWSRGIVEVRNRAAMALTLKRRGLALPTTLHLGNDPQTMEGLKTAHERRRALDHLAYVSCVSGFVRQRFLDGLDDDAQDRVRVLNTGVPFAPPQLTEKEPLIAFAGRMTAEKGVEHVADALASLLPDRPRWRAVLLGASWFGHERSPTAFESAMGERFKGLAPQVELTGYRPQGHVLDIFRRAAITLVPSLWEDPFPRVAIEAQAAGCAVIGYRRGGIGEALDGRGLLIDEPDAEALTSALAGLMDDPDHLHAIQARTVATFPFTIERAAARLDTWRDALLSSPS